MKINMGKIDRTLRVIIALVIAALYFTNILSGTWAVILLLLAAIFLVTAVAGVCPLYLPFGIKTSASKTSATE